MANTRPFAYNTGSQISGSNQIGDLAYGTLNPVNGGPNYDYNPGGVKWWMGPDEDNRYIIAKDVPAMNHPTQTPEGNIGSVRFWGTDTESSIEFLYWFNRIPGRSGLPEVSDPSIAYQWLQDNGYFTNYPPSFNEFFTFFTYASPLESNSRAGSLSYSPTQNKLFINTLNQGGTTNNRNLYGNFSIPNWTGSVSSSEGETIYYSGSDYSDQWLTSIQDTTYSKYMRSGHMVLDDENDHLYVRTIGVNGSQKGIIKYDISTSTPTVEATASANVPVAADGFPSGDNPYITYEPSSSYVITSNGATNSFGGSAAYVFNSSDLSYAGRLSGMDLSRWVIPGPDGIVLGTKKYGTSTIENYDLFAIFNLTSSSNPFNSVIANSASLGNDYRNPTSWQCQPTYVASKNKWYFPYKADQSKFDGQPMKLYVTTVDGSSYQIDTGNEFGVQTNNTGQKAAVKTPKFFIYDSSRDYFWTSNARDGAIIAIDADNFSTQITTETSAQINSISFDNAILVDDKLILIRQGLNANGTDMPVKVYDLQDIIPQ